MTIPRKCHNHEARPSWGTKRRRYEEQIMTKQTPHTKSLRHKELQQRDRLETVSRKTTRGLTHCILNRLSHTIYRKGPISILGMSGYEIYIFLEKKWLNYFQTVETLIRRRVLQRLIWVCTVCRLSFYGSPDYNGLNHFYLREISPLNFMQLQITNIFLVRTGVLYLIY